MSRQITQPAVTPNNAPRALKSLGVLVPVFNEAELNRFLLSGNQTNFGKA